MHPDGLGHRALAPTSECAGPSRQEQPSLSFIEQVADVRVDRCYDVERRRMRHPRQDTATRLCDPGTPVPFQALTLVP